MNKFGRSYRLVIDPKDGGDEIVISLPLTINFTVQRDTQASLNHLDIDIYNLSESVRNRIFQDRFVRNDRTITLEAGYDSLSQIYKGNIFYAHSWRNGTNIITSISSLDGSFDVGQKMTFQTLSAGSTIKEVLEYLVGDLTKNSNTLTRGAIGDFPDVLQRPVVLNGNTYDLIKKYSQGQVFIDMGRVYVLKNNEVIPGDLPLISPETGLLDTPKRDAAYLTVNTLFEPRVTTGQEVQLQSSILPVYNGQYKVLGVNHSGMISAAVGGQCHSIFKLLTGSEIFGGYNQVNG